MNIKDLKPHKHSHYRQGTFNPDGAIKLFESQRGKPIIYRSSWERKFILWLEKSSSVSHWGNECVGIEYDNPVSGRKSVYYPDFIVEFTDGRVVLIEIKPHHETEQPKNMRSKYAVDTYKKNIAKWHAAKEFCKRNGMQFSIITERTIEHLK